MLTFEMHWSGNHWPQWFSGLSNLQFPEGCLRSSVLSNSVWCWDRHCSCIFQQWLFFTFVAHTFTWSFLATTLSIVHSAKASPMLHLPSPLPDHRWEVLTCRRTSLLLSACPLALPSQCFWLRRNSFLISDDLHCYSGFIFILKTVNASHFICI